jgi:spore maturation protein CgeB
VRILLITATGLRTSDAPFLLAEAFNRSGHETVLLPVDAGLGRLAAAGWRAGGVTDPVYRTMFQRRVRLVAAQVQPDVAVVYGSNWSLEADTVEHLRRRLGSQVVLWEINQLIFTGAQAVCMPLYDHVFCLDSYYVPVLRAGGLGCVEHLCAAADPVEHRPLELTPDEADRFGADLSFVGSHHPARARLLETLDGLDLTIKVYGHRWEQAGAPVSDWVSSEPVYGRKKTVVYRASALSFHERGPHMLYGENFRVFEVAACGGVPITRAVPDLLRCFVPGEEVLTFESAGDFPKLIQHWLSDPAGLAAIGAAGRRRVIADHTYDHRAAAICDHVSGGRHP